MNTALGVEGQIRSAQNLISTVFWFNEVKPADNIPQVCDTNGLQIIKIQYNILVLSFSFIPNAAIAFYCTLSLSPMHWADWDSEGSDDEVSWFGMPSRLL